MKDELYYDVEQNEKINIEDVFINGVKDEYLSFEKTYKINMFYDFIINKNIKYIYSIEIRTYYEGTDFFDEGFNDEYDYTIKISDIYSFNIMFDEIDKFIYFISDINIKHFVFCHPGDTNKITYEIFYKFLKILDVKYLYFSDDFLESTIIPASKMLKLVEYNYNFINYDFFNEDYQLTKLENYSDNTYFLNDKYVINYKYIEMIIEKNLNINIISDAVNIKLNEICFRNKNIVKNNFNFDLYDCHIFYK